MQALRLTRPATLRLTARAMTVRMYSPGPEGGAGSVASSKGWHTREKAQEDQYVLQHEKEKLEKRTYAFTDAVRASLKEQEKLVGDVCTPPLTPALGQGEEVVDSLSTAPAFQLSIPHLLHVHNVAMREQPARVLAHHMHIAALNVVGAILAQPRT